MTGPRTVRKVCEAIIKVLIWKSPRADGLPISYYRQFKDELLPLQKMIKSILLSGKIT